MAPSVLIVGGGISGLSAAWFLHQRGIAVKVLEAAPAVGGTITTKRDEGRLVELGPNSTLQKPGEEDALGRLIASLGLTDRLLEAAPDAKRRFVMKRAKLAALPTSPTAFLATSIFSWKAKLRLLLEPFIGKAKTEETIARFVTRRLGKEFLDYAIEPFISGVYAGDPERLSVRAAVPKIYSLERDHGSLIRGAIARGKAAKAARTGGAPAGRMVSFDAGMGLLPQTIAEQLPEGSVVTGAEVSRLGRVGDDWTAQWWADGAAEEVRAENLVMAVPAKPAADLLRPLFPEASKKLDAIPYAPICSVALGYDREKVGHPLNGFGYLIPRREGYRLLGGLFSTTLFPGRAPEGQALVTAFIGGAMDREILELPDEAVIGQVAHDLADALEIEGSENYVSLTRYERAIPQYELGHLEKLAAFDKALEHLPGLHFRCNWRDGISVGDCVLNAEKLAARIAESVVSGS